MRYLADLRLLLARDLLRSTDATVADVAHRVGYRSEAAFGRAFRTRFGASPRAGIRRDGARYAGVSPSLGGTSGPGSPPVAATASRGR
jgi:transcriptional regulator GlxA family with amidase domain